MLGPLEVEEVMTSTRSPVCNCVSSGTILPLMRAPTQELPTWEWMR